MVGIVDRLDELGITPVAIDATLYTAPVIYLVMDRLRLRPASALVPAQAAAE